MAIAKEQSKTVKSEFGEFQLDIPRDRNGKFELDSAYKAAITDLLTEEDYTKATGMVSIASSSKFLISPVIGGIVLATGMEGILLIDICTVAATICDCGMMVSSILIGSRGLKEKYVILW